MLWVEYLHNIRKREVELVFSKLPVEHFASGLEIGAGDGFQTTLIASHVDRHISSDLNFKRIKKSLSVPGVEYKLLDADAIEGVFPAKSFDLIFSSNVLEHLRNPQKFLSATEPMLTDEAFAVHIIPSRPIKIFYLLLYYPNLLLLAFDRIKGKFQGKPFFQGAGIDLENNRNTSQPLGGETAKWGRLRKFLLPSIHGNFATHWEEFVAFGRASWEEMMMDAGYVVVTYIKGPMFSGYGFGLPQSLRSFLERIGVSSEHIFILRKMTKFEKDSWAYSKSYLSRGSFYEQKKFYRDWLKKEKNARAFLEDFKKDVGDPSGKQVLDVGFGNGIMLYHFVKAGALVHGLETEERLLGMATKLFKKHRASAELKTYDGRTFPFASNTFDYAYSTSVLEHMSYPQEVFNEIARTLKSGGKFYLSFPNKYAPKESHTGLWFISYLPREFTQKILRLFKSSPLEDWNLHFISYFDMKKMATKAGLVVTYDTKGNNVLKKVVKKSLAKLGIHHGALLKTVILVLEKPHRR